MNCYDLVTSQFLIITCITLFLYNFAVDSPIDDIPVDSPVESEDENSLDESGKG